MKVILLQDIRGTGKKDQIVEASDGYARNYLIPRKLAKEATAEALNSIERAKSADKHREDVKRAEAEAKARELKGKVIQLSVRGGENGKLYGAVTSAQVAEALAAAGIEIERKNISLPDIKELGEFEGKVKCYKGVFANIKVNVAAAE